MQYNTITMVGYESYNIAQKWVFVVMFNQHPKFPPFHNRWSFIFTPIVVYPKEFYHTGITRSDIPGTECIWERAVKGVTGGISRTCVKMGYNRNRRWNFGLIKDVLADNVDGDGDRDYGDLAGCLFGLNTLQQRNPINVTTTLQQ